MNIYERLKEYPSLATTFITQDMKGIYLYALPNRYTVVNTQILPICDGVSLLAECIFDTPLQKAYQIYIYNKEYESDFRNLCEEVFSPTT
jgi:hypothetical protein